MNLDLFNNLKENKFVQNFINELSNYLENHIVNNTKFTEHYNLLEDNLQIGNKKIISKFKDEMLIERANILQNYAAKTEDKGEMYYIYNVNTDAKDVYNLCICEPSKSNTVITKSIKDLPNGAGLGSVLRKQGEDFILENEDTKIIENKINDMISEKIKEQDEYLESKRIEGHIYEANEKSSGRIWLYDLNDKSSLGIEAIEEIEFPENLYKTAEKGDKFIYRNGEYQQYE